MMSLMKTQETIKGILEGILYKIENMYNDDTGKIYGKTFNDVKIYTDKVMEHDSKIGLSIVDKSTSSKVILLVTYDGAGYDYFSCNAEYGSVALDIFREKLKEKFGNRYDIEHETSWAFSVYDNE